VGEPPPASLASPFLLRCWQAGALHPTRLEPTTSTMDAALATGHGDAVLFYLQLSVSVLTRPRIESLRGRSTSQSSPLARVHSDPGVSFILAVDECLAVTEKILILREIPHLKCYNQCTLKCFTVLLYTATSNPIITLTL